MTGQELLEAAAKAAGYESARFHSFPGMAIRYGYGYALWINEICEYWNPLFDNADAFGLMVDCGLTIEFFTEGVDAYPQWVTAENIIQAGDKRSELYSDHDSDKYAATRLAIVRAAAGE